MAIYDGPPKKETREESVTKTTIEPNGETLTFLSDIPDNNIIFYVKNSEEVLRLEPDGNIFIRGKLTDNDIHVVDALREFVSETIVGRREEASKSVWFKEELRSAYDAGFIIKTKFYDFDKWYDEKYEK